MAEFDQRVMSGISVTDRSLLLAGLTCDKGEEHYQKPNAFNYAFKKPQEFIARFVAFHLFAPP